MKNLLIKKLVKKVLNENVPSKINKTFTKNYSESLKIQLFRFL